MLVVGFEEDVEFILEKLPAEFLAVVIPFIEITFSFMALGGWLHVFGMLQSMFILYIYCPQSLNSTITKRSKEFDDVSSKADLFFTEVLEVLHQISDRVKDDASKKADEPRKLIAELELMLQKEINEFEVNS